MKKLIIGAALAASCLAATPAFAEQFSVSISTTGLDLATPAGTELLGKRIAADAEAACARPDIRNLTGMAAFKKCKDGVVAGAAEQMAAKGVTLPAAD